MPTIVNFCGSDAARTCTDVHGSAKLGDKDAVNLRCCEDRGEQLCVRVENKSYFFSSASSFRVSAMNFSFDSLAPTVMRSFEFRSGRLAQ